MIAGFAETIPVFPLISEKHKAESYSPLSVTKGEIAVKSVIVRGAGDLASGVIHRLIRAGFPVIALETKNPSCVRRTVSYCEAVYENYATVEGLTAVLTNSVSTDNVRYSENTFPLVIDPDGETIAKLKPDVVVDAIMAKRNLGTNMAMAPLTIALGPGFCAGKDVNYVIETMRGHNLGRIIDNGTAAPNTGIPGLIAGQSVKRVVRAPEYGVIHPIKNIGDHVEEGDTIAYIDMTDTNGTAEVYAALTGILRGMIHDGFTVNKGFKIADIDPRESERDNCYTISDKARCIAGSVLELVCGKSGGAWK